MDQLLQKYNSEYQYLFAMVYKYSEGVNSSGTLASYYHMPNVARRLLENFLAFRLPHISDGLDRKFEEISFDSAKKTKVLRFLHTHSHEDHIGSSEHDNSILAETPQIMKQVLELIAHEDKPHYDRMLSLVAPSPAANTNQAVTAAASA